VEERRARMTGDGNSGAKARASKPVWLAAELRLTEAKEHHCTTAQLHNCRSGEKCRSAKVQKLDRPARQSELEGESRKQC